MLGFTLLHRDATTSLIQRDNVQLGLIQTDDHEPGKAGSLAFKVHNLDSMHHELEVNGAKPGEFGTDEWGGKTFRTFFVREEANGYCFCFYTPSVILRESHK